MYVSYHFLKLNNIMPFFGMSLVVYDVKVPLLILIYNVMTKIDKVFVKDNVVMHL